MVTNTGVAICNTKNTLSNEQQNHPAYRYFMQSLKSKYTRISYSFYLSKFLALNPKYASLSFDEILKKDPKDLESTIIDTIVRMNGEGLSSSSTNSLLASLVHFFSINDVLLNRSKIAKFINERQNKFEYRSYKHDEISRLLSILDERGKVAVLVMASTGMRVGGLVGVRLKYIQRCNIDDNNYLYKIKVYGSSSKDKYTTFCSPEAARAIDEYLHMRKRHSENLHQDPQTGNWTPGDTPLIIRQFDKARLTHKATPVHPSTPNINIISTKLRQLGIRDKDDLMKSIGTDKHPGGYRYELHPCHSLRIFAITQMQRAKIDKTIREMLVGHNIGLDRFYYKATDDEILEEYLKAVDNLTIDNEYRLQKQLEHYKKKSEDVQEIRKQIDENYERKIELIKKEMEDKFRQLIDKVDVGRIHE